MVTEMGVAGWKETERPPPVFTDRSHAAELLDMLDRSTMRGVAEAEAQRPGNYEEDEECYPCWRGFFFSSGGR